jgi:hypothetical protein
MGCFLFPLSRSSIRVAIAVGLGWSIFTIAHPSLGAVGSTGTGFFVSSTGHLVTNAHVVEDAQTIAVRVGLATYDAVIVKIDSANDLALLKVETKKKTKPLALVSTLEISKGDRVFTLGFPNPLVQGVEPKFTDGSISAFSGVKGIPNVMQITTPIQPGNSGGPLFNEEGRVVGVIVSKLDALTVLSSDSYLPENVNYAIKSDYVVPLLRLIPKEQRSSATKKKEDIESLEKSVALIIALRSSEVASPPPPNKRIEAPRTELDIPKIELMPGIQKSTADEALTGSFETDRLKPGYFNSQGVPAHYKDSPLSRSVLSQVGPLTEFTPIPAEDVEWARLAPQTARDQQRQRRESERRAQAFKARAVITTSLKHEVSDIKVAYSTNLIRCELCNQNNQPT